PGSFPSVLLPRRNDDLDTGRVSQRVLFDAHALGILTRRIEHPVVFARKQSPERRLARATRPKDEDSGRGLAGFAAPPELGVEFGELTPNRLPLFPKPRNHLPGHFGHAESSRPVSRISETCPE